MPYYYPFGEQVHPLIQEDRTPKRVFVLGVYASAVHARWLRGNEIVCRALAVASEPRIFWDGNIDEAEAIISRIHIPEAAGRLIPADLVYNGPSAKVLDERILAPLGLTRADTWLCDCLPETRLNPGQVRVIWEKYEPIREMYGLNEVTIPKQPTQFCDEKRAAEISAELIQSDAGILVLLGDIPIKQYLRRAAVVPYTSLQEYCDLYGYGSETEAEIGGRRIKVVPLAHPRQIGGLGLHSPKWRAMHEAWEQRK